MRYGVVVTYLAAVVVAASGQDAISPVTERKCLTQLGRPGVCVKYYLCDVDGTVITDGDTLIDLRIGNCPAKFDVCCELKNTTASAPVDPESLGWLEDLLKSTTSTARTPLPATRPPRPPQQQTVAKDTTTPLPTTTTTRKPEGPKSEDDKINEWNSLIDDQETNSTEGLGAESFNWVQVVLGHGTTGAPTEATITPAAPAECGWSDPGGLSAENAFRISELDQAAQGDVAEYAEFPWLVAILSATSSQTAWSTKDYLGGGSIIHPSVVITVAHKVTGKQPNEIKCRAGEYDTQSTSDSAHQERIVKKVIVHKDYFRPSLLNDIALLVLEQPLTLQPHVGVACLPRMSIPPNTKCFSSGWGQVLTKRSEYVTRPKKIDVPVLSRDMCETRLRTTRLGQFFQLHESLMCAGGEKGKDVCKGDGGSPLVCAIDDGSDSRVRRYAIFGMSAYGIDCGRQNIPGVYVDTVNMAGWVTEQMAAEGFGSTSYRYD